MRNLKQALVLAILMASLVAPPSLPVAAGASRIASSPRVTAQNHVLLVGDSLSIGLGQALDGAFAKQPGVQFSHLGKVSSGLATPSFFDWDAHLTQQVGAHHPDVVLIMLGANDDKSLSVAGHHVAFGSRGWAQAYAARLTRLHTIIRRDNPAARIFFVGVPVMANPKLDAATVRINAVLAETARRLPDSRFIDTRDVLADASGAFVSQGRDASGRLVRLRAKDGVHISAAGSRLLAARCLQAVSSEVGVATPTLLASLGRLDVRPVGSDSAAQPTMQVAEIHSGSSRIVTVVPGPSASAPAEHAAKPVADVASTRPTRSVTPPVVAAQPTAPVAVVRSTRQPRPVVAVQPAAPVAAAPVARPAASPDSYAVAEGDTMWSVAKRLGFDVAALQRANAAVDPQRLRPGQRLLLPTADRAKDVPATVAETSRHAPAVHAGAVETGLYPVAKGDTLWTLARRFDISLDAMLAANTDIDPDHLRVGQLVTIPGGGRHVAAAGNMLFPITAGDTLWDIARRFGVTVESLVEANPGIDPMRLQAGQTVHVPSSLAAVAAPAHHGHPAAPAVSENTVRRHSVQPGDTLWDLARHYNVSVEAILQENAGIDPVRLHVGQTVLLPRSVVAMAAR